MALAHRDTNKHVRFDPLFLKNEEERKEEKEKLLKMEAATEKAKCGVLFSRLFDTQHREALETALQGSPFMSQLTSVLDSINVPANDDMLTRVYSITALQMGNFDDYYEENEDFRAYIQILLYLVEKTGGVLANPVTQDNSPGRRGSGGNDGGGDGGAAGGAAPVAAA